MKQNPSYYNFIFNLKIYKYYVIYKKMMTYVYLKWFYLYHSVYFFMRSLYECIDYLTYLQFDYDYMWELSNTNNNNNNAILSYNNDVVLIKPMEYEDKYRKDLLKYSNLLRKNTDIINPETWNHLKNNTIIEYTPLGNVILQYEPNKDSFCYYSDRIIPYKYIDTVCRKYVIRFNCVPLYFDIYNNINNEIGGGGGGVTTTPNLDVVEVEEKSNKNIFVKLKSYNKSNKPDSFSSASHQHPQQTKDKNISEMRYINRFTYEGKLMNYNILQKPQKKKFSYSDFKKKI
jgi:hypothetical protein